MAQTFSNNSQLQDKYFSDEDDLCFVEQGFDLRRPGVGVGRGMESYQSSYSSGWGPAQTRLRNAENI